MSTKHIELGPLAPTLFEQLDELLSHDDIRLLELDSKALDRVYVRCLITAGAYHRGQQQLMKAIQVKVKAYNVKHR